jgi:hypothetical protein
MREIMNNFLFIKYLPETVSNLTQRMGLFKELFASQDKKVSEKDGLNDQQRNNSSVYHGKDS